MEELGISDVSEVSEPNLSDDQVAVSRFAATVGKRAAAKPADSDEDSEWDSLVSVHTHTHTQGNKVGDGDWL